MRLKRILDFFMSTGKTNFSFLKYLLPLFVTVLLFASYHRLNTFKPVKRVEIEGLVDFNRKAFDAKMGQVPGIARGRPIHITQGAFDIRLTLPEHWQQTQLNLGGSESIRFTSSDLKACVNLLLREDKMPLLEASMESPLMWLKPGVPYLGRELVQTSIDSQPAVVSDIRLRSFGAEKADDIYVPNALIVLDNRFSIVLRSCEGSSDRAFYQIYKSLKISAR
jgi:hypothetical protein